MRAAPRGAAAEPDAPSAAAMSKRPARALGAHAACAQRRPIDAISSPGSIAEAHTVQDVAYLAVSGTRTGYEPARSTPRDGPARDRERWAARLGRQVRYLILQRWQVDMAELPIARPGKIIAVG